MGLLMQAHWFLLSWRAYGSLLKTRKRSKFSPSYHFILWGPTIQQASQCIRMEVATLCWLCTYQAHPTHDLCRTCRRGIIFPFYVEGELQVRQVETCPRSYLIHSKGWNENLTPGLSTFNHLDCLTCDVLLWRDRVSTTCQWTLGIFCNLGNICGNKL